LGSNPKTIAQKHKLTQDKINESKNTQTSQPENQHKDFGYEMETI
jgi:hypothetical protein